MELYKEMLTNLLARAEIRVSFPGFRLDADAVVADECYIALQKIKAVIEDDSLSDFECVEQIVCIFEQLGSGGGSRHDFG